VIETSGLYNTAGFGSHTFYQAYFIALLSVNSEFFDNKHRADYTNLLDAYF